MTDLIKAGFDASDFVKGSKQIQDALKAIDAANRGYVRAQLSADLSLQKSAARVVGTIITSHNRQVESATRAAGRLARIEAQRSRAAETAAKREADAVVREAARAAREREKIAARAAREASRNIGKPETSLNLPINPANLAKSVVYNFANRAAFAAADAFQQGAATALEYQQQISRILTLSDEATPSFKAWSAAVLEVSSALGTDLQETAQAFYNTLSTQIGGSREQVKLFVEDALKFGQITASGAEDSVNLLSAVINTYKLNAVDAQDVSAKLFATIDLGNVVAKDLATSFGRTIVPAKQLGIPLEDVGAALAVLTNQGSSTADAQTQLLNLFNKLLKPGKELTKLYQEWGVSSAQNAVEQFGLVGILQRLNTELAKGPERLAEIITDLRGFRGSLGLTGAALNDFISAQERIANSGETYAKKLEVAYDSAGKRITTQLTEVKNKFVELGEKGINFVDQASQKLGLRLVDVVDILLALPDAARLGTLAARGLAKSTADGAEALKEYDDRMDRFIKSTLKDLNTSLKESARTVEKDLSNALNGLQSSFAPILSNLAKDSEDFEDVLKRSARLFEYVADRSVKGFTDKISDLDAEIQQVSKDAKTLGDFLLDLDRDISESFLSDAKKGATVAEQLKLTSQSVKSLLAQAAGSTDPKQSVKYLKQAFDLAKDYDRDKDRATTRLATIDERRKTIATKIAEVNENLLKERRLSSIRESKESLATRRAKNGSTRLSARLSDAASDIRTSDTLGDLTSDLRALKAEEKELAKEAASLQSSESLTSLTLQTQIDARKVLLDLQTRQADIGASTVEKLKEEQDELRAQADQYKETFTEILGLTQDLKNLDSAGLAERQARFTSLASKVAGADLFSSAGDKIRLAERLAELQNDFNTEAQRRKLSVSLENVQANRGRDITNVTDKLRKLTNDIVNQKTTILGLRKEEEALTRKQGTVGLTGEQQDRLQELRLEIADAVAVYSQLNGTLASTQTEAASLASSINAQVSSFNSLGTSVGFADSNMRDLINSVLTLKALSPSATAGSTPGFATGGYVDSVNARLTPGEYVMNRMATARFYPAIHNMNTKAASGATTTVGDINISLTSSGNEGYDAVKLGKLLRRGIRQGTVKLP
jgi:TP901 family phage tail tape measure protein